MSIANYSVLRGIAAEGKIFPPHSTHDQPHYHIRLTAAGADFDIAVNVESTDGSEVLYYINESFTPPNLTALKGIVSPFTAANQANGLGLDFVRMAGLVTRDQMSLLPISAVSGTSALHNQIDTLVQKAIQGNATIYAFGQRFQNNGHSSKNPFFGFSPDQGIHDIHMNQGNPAGSFDRDNGTYQDGALFIEWADGTWSAVFIAFQSQSFNTDDNGNVAS
jgi:uncharacterized protein YukJ